MKPPVIETIRVADGRTVTVRKESGANLEIVGLEVVGELVIPRTAVPALIESLRRLAAPE